jgi:beta-xylosidase
MGKFPLGKFLSLIFLLLVLPFLVIAGQRIQQYLGRAGGIPANIIVETKTNLGTLPQPWQALAQGGEEKEQMLSNVIPLLKPLSPRYIRIDHIYDFYDVVGGEKNGKMTFNFSKLDQVVNDILATGAKPMLSLSYMPPVISSGDVTDPPANWFDWQEVVRATIEYYSGRTGKNLTDVYYEVWNEPDLFGKWKIADYRLLYLYAAQGASQAKNVNSFKIGGPGTTAFYKNWLEDFVKYVYQNDLRLDFFSWHKYSTDPGEFLADINFIDSLLAQHGGSYLLPKFITEWGSTPENSPFHDTNFDAAHTVAVIRQILDRVDLTFTFEIKDGPPPPGKNFWGRWGVLTHETAGLSKKPKYFALQLLDKMRGERLKITGEGTWVTGFAGKDNQTVKLILVNYDKDGRNSENVPITFTGLEPGTYTLGQTFLGGKTLTTSENVVISDWSKTIYMPPNTVLLLEFKGS